MVNVPTQFSPSETVPDTQLQALTKHLEFVPQSESSVHSEE